MRNPKKNANEIIRIDEAGVCARMIYSTPMRLEFYEITYINLKVTHSYYYLWPLVFLSFCNMLTLVNDFEMSQSDSSFS